MAQDFLVLSSSYMKDTLPEIRKRNSIIAEELTNEYEASAGEKNKIVEKLQESGLRAGKSLVNTTIRSYRDAWVYLNRNRKGLRGFQKEEFLEELKEVQIRLKEKAQSTRPLQRLLKDGINNWQKVEELLKRKEEPGAEKEKEKEKKGPVLTLPALGNILAELADLSRLNDLASADDDKLVENILLILNMVKMRLAGIADKEKEFRELQETYRELEIKLEQTEKSLEDRKEKLEAARKELRKNKTLLAKKEEELARTKIKIEGLRKEIEQLQKGKPITAEPLPELPESELDITIVPSCREEMAKLPYRCEYLDLDISYTKEFEQAFCPLLTMERDLWAKGITLAFENKKYMKELWRKKIFGQIIETSLFSSEDNKLEWEFLKDKKILVTKLVRQ